MRSSISSSSGGSALRTPDRIGGSQLWVATSRSQCLTASNLSGGIPRTAPESSTQVERAQRQYVRRARCLVPPARLMIPPASVSWGAASESDATPNQNNGLFYLPTQ